MEAYCKSELQPGKKFCVHCKLLFVRKNKQFVLSKINKIISKKNVEGGHQYLSQC